MTVLDSFFKNFLEPFSYFIYAVVFFLKSCRDKTFGTKLLFIYYLCAILLLFVAGFLVIYTAKDLDNNWLYNIFFLLTICVLSYYFYHLFSSKAKKNAVIFLLVINVLLFIVYDIILGHFFKEFNGYVYAICFASVVVYALFYFDQLLRNVNELNILHDFDFWLVSGYLIYFLGAFCIILYYEESSDEYLRGNIWAVQNIIIFLSSLVTLAGYFRINSRKKRY